MRVLVYGGGAVGLGLASSLIKSGAEVHIITRGETVSALRAQGLRRTGIFGFHAAPPGSFTVSTRFNEIPPQTIFDFILVCVKSFDTPATARDFQQHRGMLGPQTRLVLCQNGWGNREAFLAQFPGPPLYSARIITGFTCTRKNQVEITVHADAIHIGTLGSEDLTALEPLCAAISAGDLPCQVTPFVERDLWAKMLYNCSLNPLGALFDVPYGRLAESAHTRGVMNAIHEEIFRVMAAAGHQTHWSDVASYQERFYGQMVPSTAAHCSSTLQDIRAGKRTEIDALNGAIVALGHQHNIPVPINATILSMVKFLEEHHK